MNSYMCLAAVDSYMCVARVGTYRDGACAFYNNKFCLSNRVCCFFLNMLKGCSVLVCFLISGWLFGDQITAANARMFLLYIYVCVCIPSLVCNDNVRNAIELACSV